MNFRELRNKLPDIDIKEVRAAIAEFCRKRQIPEPPQNWSEHQLRTFHARSVESRSRVVQHSTRISHVRASGATKPAPAATPSVSNTEEREQRLRKSLAALA